MTSKTVADRFSQHRFDSRSDKSHIFANAIRKYGKVLIVEKVLVAEEDYCYMIEKKLRPNERIGWNTVVGGGKPPVFSKPHSAEAKRKISEASIRTSKSPARIAAILARKGVKRSEETKRRMSEKAQGRCSWETSRADKTLWAVADKIYQAYCDNPGMGFIKLEQLLGYKKHKLQPMYEKFKNLNWNPLTDTKWSEWAKEYLKESR